MEITSTPINPSRQPNAAPGSGGALSSDFETFLLMLTTQMENQDPLNPIESSDFAVQLATFSGVEQQVRTNELLASMVAGSSMADLASWVGLSARVEGSVSFDGSPVRIDVGAERSGLDRQMVVRSSQGAIVTSESIPDGVTALDWVGTGATGQILPTGSYDISVQYLLDGEVTATQPASSFSRIEEARRTNEGTELLLANGALVSAADVDAIREVGY